MRTRGVFAALLASAALVAGCSTGSDAVVSGSQFEFVAPGGKTTIRYDPPSARKPVGQMSAESVLEPGKRIALSDYRGKVVELNVWGSWCGPCRAEAPELEQVYDETKASGVQFLGIDVRDDRDAAADFIRDRGVSYPSLFDPPGRTLLALKGFPHNVVPSTIVLDRRHRVAVIFLKPLLAEDLLPEVRRVAAEQREAAA